ncbi:MAG: hypothetical protein QXF61_06260 [Nitrososphaeria archaeon]
MILVDGGPWYPWALDGLGLKWIHVTFGNRNAIERYFRTLKERFRGFQNNLNTRSRRNNGYRSHGQDLGIWIYPRAHQSLRAPPLGW